uniref:Uncharacterized protein n=1 Tax=Larimichthys crocea TaxID=215358 RepID=A0A0F8AFH7_LARCR
MRVSVASMLEHKYPDQVDEQTGHRDRKQPLVVNANDRLRQRKKNKFRDVLSARIDLKPAEPSEPSEPSEQPDHGARTARLTAPFTPSSPPLTRSTDPVH